MPEMRDLSGQRFGKWTATFLGRAPDHKWLCRCECGTEKAVAISSLSRGESKSCGCARVEYSRLKRPLVDLTGSVFGEWTVLARGKKEVGGYRWFCRCSCGNVKEILACSLKCGDSTCCGHDQRVTHGHSRGYTESPTMKSFHMMWQRCSNPNYTGYANYGGRGIKVCERWESFENFLADMGERPSGTSLDRFPNNAGNYEPGNCRWATSKEQAINKRQRQRTTFYPKRELSGLRFGSLTVQSFSHYGGKRGFHQYWNCRCACGTQKAIRADGLLSGLVTGCGSGCVTHRRRRLGAQLKEICHTETP